MTLTGWSEIALVLALIAATALPLGLYMAKVLAGERTFLSAILGPVERGFYALAGFHLFALRPMRLIQPRLNTRRRTIMLDAIFIVLGFGGILAMAAYAVLCGRI